MPREKGEEKVQVDKGEALTNQHDSWLSNAEEACLSLLCLFSPLVLRRILHTTFKELHEVADVPLDGASTFLGPNSSEKSEN